MKTVLPFLFFALAACQSTVDGSTSPANVTQGPIYLGSEVALLEEDLVNFTVSVQKAANRSVVAEYAKCVAAQYTLIRGFSFARHVRTQVVNETGIWVGDAVYTVSATLPDGMKTIDAEVTVEDCKARGIPTV